MAGSAQLAFKEYELWFSKGLIAKILGKPPIPPNRLARKKCIAWGDGYIYGGRDNYKVEDIKKLWVRSGLSGRTIRKINSSSS